jgi:hypothetical protein
MSPNSAIGFLSSFFSMQRDAYESGNKEKAEYLMRVQADIVNSGVIGLF